MDKEIIQILEVFGYRALIINESKVEILDDGDNVIGNIKREKRGKHKSSKPKYKNETLERIKERLALLGIDYRKPKEKDKSKYLLSSIIGSSKVEEEREETDDNVKVYEYDFRNEYPRLYFYTRIGKTSEIRVCSDNYGFFSFSVSKNKLTFNIPTTDSTSNFDQTIVLQFKNNYSTYLHTLSYYNKNKKLKEVENSKTHAINAQCKNTLPNQINIRNWNFKNGGLVKEHNTDCVGTITDVILKDDLAINSFILLKSIIEKILSDIKNYAYNNEKIVIEIEEYLSNGKIFNEIFEHIDMPDEFKIITSYAKTNVKVKN